jgi:hypothetical protein
MIRRMLCLSATATAALVLAGCQSAQTAGGDAAAPGMINDACPLSGGAINPDARTATWNDGTVGFCCNGCASTWDGMSEADRAAKLADVTD